MRTNKKELSLAEQAILDARDIITAAEETVKKELNESISNNITKKFMQNLDKQDFDEEEEEEKVMSQDDGTFEKTKTEQVEDFLDDYITPEVSDDSDDVIIDDEEEQELLFDQDQIDSNDSDWEEDEELNSDQLDEIVDRLLEDDSFIDDEEDYSDEEDEVIETKKSLKVKNEKLDDADDDQIDELIEELKSLKEKNSKVASLFEFLLAEEDDNVEEQELDVEEVDDNVDGILHTDQEEKEELKQEVRRYQAESRRYKRELRESQNYINSVTNALNDSKLLTTKSNYIKILSKNYNLNENTIKKIVNSFDKANNVRQAKLVYESIDSALQRNSKKANKTLSQNMIYDKRVGSTRPSKPIINQISRFRELANLK